MSEQDPVFQVAVQAVLSDVFRFASDGGAWRASLPVSGFQRLAGFLASAEGEVTASLTGNLGVDGKPRLDLHVEGSLVLTCQRCLEGLEWTLAVERTFLPVPAGQPLPDDELENDEIDVIEIDGGLDVPTLVEDEIILSLPVVPRHEGCVAFVPVSDGDKAKQKETPFAVLSGLLGPR